MAKKKASKQVKKKWLAGIDWGLFATLLAVPISVIALFQSCNSNRIAKSIYPSVTVTSSASFPIRNTQTEGYVTVVCRRQVRVVNEGGSGTSVISLEPIGDFGEGGYLPTFATALGAFDFSKIRFVRVLPFLPVPINLTYTEQSLKGPIPYKLSVAKYEDATSANIDFDEDKTVDENQPLGIGELLRALRDEPPLSELADVYLGEPSPVFETDGLPFYLPDNSAQDIVIDFRYTVPKLADLRNGPVRDYMEQNGIDPRVGYKLNFPDISPIELERVPCYSPPTSNP